MARWNLFLLICSLSSCLETQSDVWGLTQGYSLASKPRQESVGGDGASDELTERQTRQCPPTHYPCSNANWCCPTGSNCAPQLGFGVTLGCCPTYMVTCGGWACALPGSVCCDVGRFVCEEGETCCGETCCSGGETCSNGVCIESTQSPSRTSSTRSSSPSGNSGGSFGDMPGFSISESISLSTSVSTSLSTSISLSYSLSTSLSNSISLSRSASASLSASRSASASRSQSDSESETPSSTTSSTPSTCSAGVSKRTPGPGCPTECHPESPWKDPIPVVSFGHVPGFSSQLTNHICRGIRTTSEGRVAQGRSDGVNYDILTLGTRSGQDARRSASGCNGYCSGQNRNTTYPDGVSCDEYPPASAAEGGAGADIQCINRWQNEFLGGRFLWSLFNGENCNIQEGDPFIIRVTPGCASGFSKRDDDDDNLDPMTYPHDNATVVRLPGQKPFIGAPIGNLDDGSYNLHMNAENPSAIKYMVVYDKYGTQYGSVNNLVNGDEMNFDSKMHASDDFAGILMAQTDEAQNIQVSVKFKASGNIVRTNLALSLSTFGLLLLILL